MAFDLDTMTSAPGSDESDVYPMVYPYSGYGIGAYAYMGMDPRPDFAVERNLYWIGNSSDPVSECAQHVGNTGVIENELEVGGYLCVHTNRGRVSILQLTGMANHLPGREMGSIMLQFDARTYAPQI